MSTVVEAVITGGGITGGAYLQCAFHGVSIRGATIVKSELKDCLIDGGRVEHSTLSNCVLSNNVTVLRCPGFADNNPVTPPGEDEHHD